MSNRDGLVLAKTSGSDRFYKPPVFRKNQKQLQKPLEPETVEPALSNLSNFDSLLVSLTPMVPAQLSPSCEPGMKGSWSSESNEGIFFYLEELWESFREWSAYGVEVPLMLNGADPIMQYYVPYLSAIQLYAEPQRLRKLSEDSGAESSKETSSAGSSDSESNKQVRGVNLMDIDSQRLSRLTLRKRATLGYSTAQTEVCNSPGQLVYEFFEGTPPHFRPPFHDKVSTLASEFPCLMKYRSCDISSSSWFSVAWYPICRIPNGSTLKNLDASFLTFHSLSTHSISKNQPQFHTSSGRKAHGVDGSSNKPLPIFALASYKLRGTILTPNGASESQQMNSLLQAATDWLQDLQVKHPDYEYFVSHGSQWK